MDEPTPIPTPQPEPKREEYLTLAQAARISGYQQDYLGQLAREGKLKAIKSGHNWIVASSELDLLMNKHKREIIATEQKPKIEDVILKPAQETILQNSHDPLMPHPMITMVSEEPLTHAPTIPLNV